MTPVHEAEPEPEDLPGPDARHLWSLFEPVHAVVYFAPEAREHFERAGLRGFWRGYFAGRAAPLGPVDAAPVTALFFSFAPALTTRALPAVWSLASPRVALQARQDGAVAALRRLLAEAGVPGGAVDGDGSAVAEAAELAVRAARAAPTSGRALAAALAALEVPAEPLAALWHAATVLREHRGDGHVAALVAAGLDGPQVLVLRSGADLSRELLQPARGWTDTEWDAAAASLRARGLLDGDGVATPAGRELMAGVEEVTDRLAAQPWTAIGAQATARLADLLGPISAAARAGLPERTPIGLPPPPAAG
jgi:hypothetical protein